MNLIVIGVYMENQNWYDNYSRGFRTEPLKYKAENPSTRGLRVLSRIWSKILPTLRSRNVAEAPDELPKDVSKWAVLPDWVELLEKYPHTHRNVFDWMDSWVPSGGYTFRNGAATLRRVPHSSAAREKQHGQGFNDPTPAFTFHGERLPYNQVKAMLQKWVEDLARTGGYPNAELLALDRESLEDWTKVMGGRCSTYVFAESGALFHGMTPHQETDASIPWDIFWNAWRGSLAHEFPHYGPKKSTLTTRELFVGVAGSRGISIQNKDGSGGYPYTNMDRERLQKVLDRPKFKGRSTKGQVFPHAMRTLVQWIEGGMPMTGELYDAVATPATLAYRGDRAVELDIRALASRSQRAETHAASNRLAAMLPSRSIIIVSTVLVLAQSLWAQPLGNHIAETATPGFDWVDPDHSIVRLDEIRMQDLAQAGAHPIASVGADASGWDRDVTGQMIAGDTAWYMSMFPQKARLLYIDTILPVEVSDEWVQATKSELGLGETGTYRLTQLLNDGSLTTGDCDARVIEFDMWEFISKVMTLINDCPIRWADYEMDAPGILYDLAGADPAFRGYHVISNGGRKTGDAATGIGNSWANLVVTPAAAAMHRDPSLAKVIARRTALQDSPPGKPYVVKDMFSRGDDLALLIELTHGGIPSELAASGIQSIGMRANAKKQEASDIPGKPVFGFANVLVTEEYIGKLIGRSTQRYMVQESRGLSLEMLNAVKEVGNDTEYSDTLIGTTSTAKARLAPLAGFPLMDSHPLADRVARWAVHNDKYRLSYVMQGALTSDGQVTGEAREMMTLAAEVEAKAQARLRAKRDNVDVDLEKLKEFYLGATIHDLVIEHALVDGYVPHLAMERVDNHTLFKEAVRLDEPLEL